MSLVPGLAEASKRWSDMIRLYGRIIQTSAAPKQPTLKELGMTRQTPKELRRIGGCEVFGERGQSSYKMPRCVLILAPYFSYPRELSPKFGQFASD